VTWLWWVGFVLLIGVLYTRNHRTAMGMLLTGLLVLVANAVLAALSLPW
jgi:hypothetical protein